MCACVCVCVCVRAVMIGIYAQAVIRGCIDWFLSELIAWSSWHIYLTYVLRYRQNFNMKTETLLGGEFSSHGVEMAP